MPVVLYSILYNLPKFFELTTACPGALQKGQNFNQTSSDFELSANTTTTQLSADPHSSLAQVAKQTDTCSYWELQLVAREIRLA